jgi:hypothetical protein
VVVGQVVTVPKTLTLHVVSGDSRCVCSVTVVPLEPVVKLKEAVEGGEPQRANAMIASSMLASSMLALLCFQSCFHGIASWEVAATMRSLKAQAA